ncbi:hypothetical protein A3C75_02260 [Candidatus Giovannonibacteria bacterium RIFCSPHIGHO2_02_FULL_44_31]|nr:MAG: hypothetical protein A3C75_02260 [Candidatus Giovannonibacteria bacterium RIFCSPHIGHO2_02_FULL_44_31]OGF76257.1 MAG: hypothetical protein A3E62_03955 [Candidatus Giovannonibacteria bacterium RIFCSPHIGHO2_12_FULL_44_29]
MKKENKKIKMSYEPEADVLRIESGRAPIDYATEMGNVVVHFTKKGVPVYFEILEATRFLKNASRMLVPGSRKALIPSLR